jgi:hypothetical protein
MSSFHMQRIMQLLNNFVKVSLSPHNQTNPAIMMNALPITVLEISHLMSRLRNSPQCFTCPYAHLLSQIKLTSMQHTVIIFFWNIFSAGMVFCLSSCFVLYILALVL